MKRVPNQTHLEVLWQTLIGHAKRQGATDEELNILVKAMDLIRKYQR